MKAKEYAEIILESDILSLKAKADAKKRGLTHQSHNIWKDKQGKEYKWNSNTKRFDEVKIENKAEKPKSKSQEIKETLKKLGYTNRQISVTSRNGGYSSSINVKIKSLDVDIKKVKDAVSKYEKVSHDERSGEILSGGNTFVFVEFDYNLFKNEAKKYLEKAKNIVSKNADIEKGRGVTIEEDGRYVLKYTPNLHYGPSEISILLRPKNFKELNFYVLDTKERYSAYNVESVAEAIAKFHYYVSHNPV